MLTLRNEKKKTHLGMKKQKVKHTKKKLMQNRLLLFRENNKFFFLNHQI